MTYKKTFSFSSNLKRHLLGYTNWKKYVREMFDKKKTSCEICKSSFCNLREHLHVFTKEKSYVCDISKNCDLRRQLHIHTNEKFNVSEICKRPFLKNQN
ncbi:UNVERIFIED_CONTAM: zinc finger protein [Trichonephila clavipes]